MKADNRRKEIVSILSGSQKPVAGGTLAERLHASRQIIVQDIALLRAAGYDILSTHTGYLMKSMPLSERTFKVYHTGEQTADELRTIVELGGTVSGEHGIGLEKKEYMPLQLGDEQMRIMQGICRLFDPYGIMNPGKLER